MTWHDMKLHTLHTFHFITLHYIALHLITSHYITSYHNFLQCITSHDISSRFISFIVGSWLSLSSILRTRFEWGRTGSRFSISWLCICVLSCFDADLDRHPRFKILQLSPEPVVVCVLLTAFSSLCLVWGLRVLLLTSMHFVRSLWARMQKI